MRLLTPAIAILAACGGSTPRATTPEERVRLEPDRDAIVDGRTGAPVAYDAMVASLLDARVVYVGEQHGKAPHHAVQRAVFEAIVTRDPSVALGMEQFQRPFQEALDAYSARAIDEARMLAETQYDARWSLDFGYYRPTVVLARDRGRGVVALNAPKEITRAVGRGGLDALDDEQRAALPELDLEDAAHRSMIREALGDHPGFSGDAFERIYAAQVIWDETMATTVADTLDADDGPARLVVIAGAMHVAYGLGIPERAARRGAEPYRIVLPVTEAERAELSHDDEAPADFLWLVPEE